MSLADLSIKRPIFISCIVILMLAVGYLSLKRLPVDLFPNITIPVVTATVQYPGAGPKEIETLVSKPLEDEMSTLPGIKTLRSVNREGVSQVIAEFTLETDIKYAEQQIRDRVSSARSKLPTDIKEPVIRRMDPADQPILVVAIKADLPMAKLYDIVDQDLKPKIEQVNQVGLVEIAGGRKREIRVELDREKIKIRKLPATEVYNRLAATGQDVPAGKFDNSNNETVYRTLGEFKSLKDIEDSIVSYRGDQVPITVREIGKVVDSLEDETSRAYVDGQPSLFLMVFRQAGSNTVAVVDAVKARVAKMNTELKNAPGKPELTVVQDGSKRIRANIDDVNESIVIGIILTVVVVFVFLRSARSTLITSLALPNSLLGSFILMAVAGFTINIMTLLALSLAVGLLIDDAIVVRENIFRHNEMGKDPVEAAVVGTKEVSLAVIATTFTVIAVFGPIAFLKGVVGQFFREFGLTICFAMLISLFDALTIAPMLSAYLAKHHDPNEKKNVFVRFIDKGLDAVDRGQTWLENKYAKLLGVTMRKPLLVLISAIGIFFGSIMLTKYIPKTFIPPQDSGEIAVSLELPPGTSIGVMSKLSLEVDELIRKNKEVIETVLTVGNTNGEVNKSTFFIQMIDSHHRKMNTSEFKDILRQQLKPYAKANPIVKDPDGGASGGQRPFNLNIIGTDMEELQNVTAKVFEKIRNHPALKDVDISYRPGKPEIQVALDNRKAERLGVSSVTLGNELRTQIEGMVPAVFRENGREYDIRVRVQEDQRDLEKAFSGIVVPNVNQTVIPLTAVASPVKTIGPANITRQDRGRYIQIAADVSPTGPGMGAAIADIKAIFEKEPLPAGMRYQFVGQAENFQELGESMVVAMGLGILFIYLVLASLYESFVTPFTIMLVLPLAACGAFAGLFVMRTSLDLFSMIGCVMLLGIATKNSILLVDYTNQLIGEGKSRYDAIVEAGKTRLRPILMTTIALIAGMLPVAIGLNEASKQRTSMGVAIIGGLISSTLLTLVVVPAAYSYIDRFRLWSGAKMKSLVQGKKGKAHSSAHGTPAAATPAAH